MKLIVITSPEMLPGEAAIVNELLANGLTRLHVRKPGADKAEMRSLLEQTDPVFRNRIALHQHHELAGELGITGLHFTEKDRLTQREGRFQTLKNNGSVISTSLHHPAELETLPHYFDYALLGPVFDSISKKGYLSKLPGNFKLERRSFPGKVIALGGIHAENLKSAWEMGFDGAAVLGTIWQNPATAIDQFLQLQSLQLSLQSSFSKSFSNQSFSIPGLKPGDPKKKDEGDFIDKLHFISNENDTMSHIGSIRLALEAGCRWIQLRVKDRAEEEVLPIAWEATRLCDSYGAKLIINDFPRVALAVEAHGLHLGLADTPLPEARALVGDRMIIGGTANTWEDILRRIGEGADYIGLGPFRFTQTKQNLSPILGLEGYSAFMQKMREAGHSTPIIAIGGITSGDVNELRQAGLYGVAMSGALTNAADPKQTVHQILQALC